MRIEIPDEVLQAERVISKWMTNNNLHTQKTGSAQELNNDKPRITRMEYQNSKPLDESEVDTSEKRKVAVDDDGVEFVLSNGEVIQAYVNELGLLTVCAARGRIVVLPKADNAVNIATSRHMTRSS